MRLAAGDARREFDGFAAVGGKVRRSEKNGRQSPAQAEIQKSGEREEKSNHAESEKEQVEEKESKIT